MTWPVKRNGVWGQPLPREAYEEHLGVPVQLENYPPVRTLATMTPEERDAVCAQLGAPMSIATKLRLERLDRRARVNVTEKKKEKHA